MHVTAPTSEKVLERRAKFESFYRELLPALVTFVDSLGIKPAHEVLNNANQFIPFLDMALQDLIVANNDERVWLTTQVGYFIGECFAQRHSGCWYLEESLSAEHFGRYVVGRFEQNPLPVSSIDPFEKSMAFVSLPPPRRLALFLVNDGCPLSADP